MLMPEESNLDTHPDKGSNAIYSHYRCHASGLCYRAANLWVGARSHTVDGPLSITILWSPVTKNYHPLIHLGLISWTNHAEPRQHKV